MTFEFVRNKSLQQNKFEGEEEGTIINFPLNSLQMHKKDRRGLFKVPFVASLNNIVRVRKVH